MQISKKHQFVFIDIPKTASLSLDTIFQEKFGSELSIPPKKSQLRIKHSRIIPSWALSYVKVTCVRNPFERLCSLYHFMRQQNLRGRALEYHDSYFLHMVRSFDDFIDRCIEYNSYPDDEIDGHKYRLFPMWKYLEPIGYDIILKQERLEEDFLALPFVKNIVELPLKNNNKLSWYSEYSEERRQKIVEWAGKDFDLFGYNEDYIQ